MFYRVQSVQPVPDMALLVTFQNGQKKRYDVKPLLHRFPSFAQLQEEKGLFEQVQVDLGGYGISWNDEIDLSCNELWESGQKQ